MQQSFSRRIAAATFFMFMLLFAISMTPAAQAAPQMVFDVVVDLQSTPPRALNQVTGNPMSSSDPQVVNPNDTDVYKLHPANMAGEPVELWVVLQNQSTGQTKWSAQQITQTVQYAPWATAKIRSWVQKDRAEACANAERLDPQFKCDPVVPQVRQVRIVVTGANVAAIDDATGQPVGADDPRAINPDLEESKLIGGGWIVGLEIDDTVDPALRRVSVNYVDPSSSPIYGVSELAPGKFQGTRVWAAASEEDANAEAWRLKDSLGQLKKLYLPAVQR